MAEHSTTRRAALAGTLVLGFAVLLILVETKWGPLYRLDLDVADDLHEVALDHPGQVDWWQWVSRVLHPDVERIAYAAVAVGLWLAKRARVALFVVIVMAGAAALESVTKLAVGRDRPVLTDAVASAAGKSFPSGHAMTAVVAFGLLVVLVPRRFKIAAAAVGVVAVLVVSYSRLALGVHYLSDVLGGWLLGAAWLVLADWLLADRLLRRATRWDNRVSGR